MITVRLAIAPLVGLFACGALAASVSGCGSPPPQGGGATPVYSKTTGRLEQLVSDRNGDGRPDARAFMDGTTLRRIELDRNADGKPDRWEYYTPAAGTAAEDTTARAPAIVKAEEANGTDERVTRRETYEAGQLVRVEEDVDSDGRMDKWETYVEGRLRYVDLDVDGSGSAGQRLTYAANGSVTSEPIAKAEAR
jgi:hypothetical protein